MHAREERCSNSCSTMTAAQCNIRDVARAYLGDRFRFGEFIEFSTRHADDELAAQHANDCRNRASTAHCSSGRVRECTVDRHRE